MRQINDLKGSKIVIRSCDDLEKDLLVLHEGPLGVQAKIYYLHEEDVAYLKNPNELSTHKKYSREMVGLLCYLKDNMHSVTYKYYDVFRDPETNNFLLKMNENPDFIPEQVDKYMHLVSQSNFTYLYDKQKLQFYFKKTYPIAKGVVIADIIGRQIITLDGDLNERKKRLYNYGFC